MKSWLIAVIVIVIVLSLTGAGIGVYYGVKSNKSGPNKCVGIKKDGQCPAGTYKYKKKPTPPVNKSK